MTTTTETEAGPRAWHGDPRLAREVHDRVDAHREADSIVRGVYQTHDPKKALRYRGCALGCTLPDLTHGSHFSDVGHELVYAKIRELYGIPADVAAVVDAVFEASPVGEGPAFAVSVVRSTPVGADLSGVVLATFRDYAADLAYAVRNRSNRSGIRAAVGSAVDMLRGGSEPDADAVGRAYGLFAECAADVAPAAGVAPHGARSPLPYDEVELAFERLRLRTDFLAGCLDLLRFCRQGDLWRGSSADFDSMGFATRLRAHLSRVGRSGGAGLGFGEFREALLRNLRDAPVPDSSGTPA